MSAEDRLKELGIELPPAPPPSGSYVNAVQAGNLLFLAGKGPWSPDGPRPAGKVGADVSVEEAYEHARSVGLMMVAVLKDTLGSLDRVKQIVKVLGMVNGTPDFGEHPKVINGCSDLFVEIFGDRGKHARSAVGMAELPMGSPVEVEIVVEVRSA